MVTITRDRERDISLASRVPFRGATIVVKRAFSHWLQAASQTTFGEPYELRATEGSVTDKVEDEKNMIRLKARDAQSNPAISDKSKACMLFLAKTLDEPHDLSDEDWQEIEGLIQSAPLRFGS